LQTLTATFASFVHGGNDVRYEVWGSCSTEYSQVIRCMRNLKISGLDYSSYWTLVVLK
jgi:phosphate/sulfate permease